MSEYIDKSKHAEGTAKAEGHIMRGEHPGSGDSRGAYNNSDPTTAAPHVGSEGAPGKGVNYELKADAGHFVSSIGEAVSKS